MPFPLINPDTLLILSVSGFAYLFTAMMPLIWRPHWRRSVAAARAAKGLPPDPAASLPSSSEIDPKVPIVSRAGIIIVATIMSFATLGMGSLAAYFAYEQIRGIQRWRQLAPADVSSIDIFRMNTGPGGAFNNWNRTTDAAITIQDPPDVAAAFTAVGAMGYYGMNHESFTNGYLLRFNLHGPDTDSMWMFVYSSTTRNNHVAVLRPTDRREDRLGRGGYGNGFGTFISPGMVNWVDGWVAKAPPPKPQTRPHRR